MNVEGRLAGHHLRLTILFPFRAFVLSSFRDYLFWVFAFDICHSFGIWALTFVIQIFLSAYLDPHKVTIKQLLFRGAC